MRTDLLALVGSLVLAGCDLRDTCANQLVARARAPDGSREAVIFQRDCGATTSFSTQVSVIPAGSSPVAGGNAFVADANHGAAGRAAWGGPWAELRWRSPTLLVIRYDRRARTLLTAASVDGVSVEFERVDPPAQGLLARTRTRARGDIAAPIR